MRESTRWTFLRSSSFKRIKFLKGFFFVVFLRLSDAFLLNALAGAEVCILLSSTLRKGLDVEGITSIALSFQMNFQEMSLGGAHDNY